MACETGYAISRSRLRRRHDPAGAADEPESGFLVREPAATVRGMPFSCAHARGDLRKFLTDSAPVFPSV